MLTRATAARKVAGRRLAGTSTGARMGAKLPPRENEPEHKPSDSKEAARIIVRRVQKAERDERIDISLALTPSKTYEGGFTRPRDLRASNWFPGGPYHNRGKVYESPPEEAYEPYTVYLLESRYPVKHAPGVTDYPEHIVGICRENALPAVLGTLNNPSGLAIHENAKEAMDNARWPFMKQKRAKPVVWWEPGEDPKEILRKLVDEPAESEGVSSAPTADVRSKPRHGATPNVALLASTSAPRSPSMHRRGFHFSAPARADAPDSSDSSFRDRDNIIKTSSWSKPPKPSQDADDNVVPTFYVERKKQWDDISERKETEGSLMAELNAGILSEGLAASVRAREEKIPVEVRLADGTIQHPSGFEPPTAETDFHPAAAKQPTEEDPDSVLLTVKQLWDERDFTDVPEAPPIEIDPEVKAQYVKRLVQDILTPSNTPSADQTVNQPAPAGIFDPVSPSTVTTAHARANIPTSSWDSPARSTSKSNDPDETVPPYYIERKRQRESVSERKEEEGSLMAELNAGILSEDLAATVRSRTEKIPVEVILEDGTVAHPSGFEPPTPETDFHPSSAKPPEAPPKTHWTELTVSKGKDARGFHWSVAARASEVPDMSHMIPALAVPPPTPVRGVSTAAKQASSQTLYEQEDDDHADVHPGYRHSDLSDLQKVREQYAPLLAEQPFWRPLLAITVSTRPLANSLARLSRGLERGMPWHATISLDDRKTKMSLPGRLREMRLNRMRQLTVDMAKLLAGQRGGIVGIRFGVNDKGRAVGGEGLADPIPLEKRVMKVGVAEWFKRAEEVKELFGENAKEAGVGDAVEVFGLDERGRRVDNPA